MKVVNELDMLFTEALTELFNEIGQPYNGTYIYIWASELAHQFYTGEAINENFDGK